MPLLKSSSPQAFKSNIAEMVRAGHPQSQAVAAAYRNARENGAKFALGGMPLTHHVGTSMASMHPPGLIRSAVPGRTDRHEINVPSGSYIFTAEHVSHLGQGNTLAGEKVLNGMFGVHPQVPHHMGAGMPRVPSVPTFAQGGSSSAVPIVVAGGEYLLHPDQVMQAGGGDLKRGHDALDKWQNDTRKQQIKTLRKLPGPKK